ncbi:dynamin family protein [Leptolyngbya sp. NIES-2104]|uniref:dynamin family protein n=1 Tax=Leptolyngbya sp. NIES-2104 TaxID=1552121 RepID=UPI0006EC7C90|nr:dynamin family protein [Leptolyngbya sp. NIES-2104]GAP99679.1 hypothetical protein NIES2104_62450 [Leptolyngbya sp. NIES-2104]
MSIDVDALLQNTRTHLSQLGTELENLVQAHSEVFEDANLQAKLAAFRAAQQDAIARLQVPTFYIAMIGTTSSGKSTIVNALVGRRIAPIEAGEMSGGVLTLTQAAEPKLVVQETKGAIWETGTWTDLSDEQIYDRVRNQVMLPYHQARKTQDLIAPQVTVHTALLPASDQSLLQLPTGVNLEIIDLPGLKSVQDAANLAVIQSRVNKAFSLVALDYMQVDDEQRKRLLEELKRVVKHLQGRTDSMIFVLNRVDQQGADDLPMNERIDLLRSEIQQVLELKDLPEVLPFSARILYYAQCAWGTEPLDAESRVAPETRLKLLNALFQDCAGMIGQYTRSDRNLRNWFRDVEDQVADGATIDDDTMRQILHYARLWSGGQELWERLRLRVQHSFPELVLLPSLVEVFDNFDALATALNSLSEIRRIQCKDEVEQQQQKLSDSRKRLQSEIKAVHKRFQALTEQIIDYLKKDDPDSRSQLSEICREEKLDGFQLLFEAIDTVEKDLTSVLLKPVQTAFQTNQGSYELEEKLRDVVGSIHAHEVARAYDLVSRKLGNFTRESDYYIKRVHETDTKAVRDLEQDERAMRKLYQTVRDAASARAEYMIQAQAQKLDKALRSVIEAQGNRLCEVCRRELPAFGLDDAIAATYHKAVAQNLPKLSEQFFEFLPKINQRDTSQREVVDRRAVTTTYTEGSCFNRRERTRTEYQNVMGDVKYKELLLPHEKTMARQWGEGVAKKKSMLWDILRKWFVRHLDDAKGNFGTAANDVLDLAERALAEQLAIIEQTLEAELKKWDEINASIASTAAIRKTLEVQTRSSHQ